MWTRTDPTTGVASILLSTINMKLFEEARHMIRVYSAHTGYKLETYNKSQFIKRYGISMYVPKENANLPPLRLLRSLFYKNPTLRTRKVTFLCKTVFESDPPNHPKGRRSRIGDAIFLFDSPELAEKLRPFKEDQQFYFNGGFSVTLKGGDRDGSNSNFAHATMSTVISSSAAEAMRAAASAAS